MPLNLNIPNVANEQQQNQATHYLETKFHLRRGVGRVSRTVRTPANETTESSTYCNDKHEQPTVERLLIALLLSKEVSCRKQMLTIE